MSRSTRHVEILVLRPPVQVAQTNETDTAQAIAFSLSSAALWALLLSDTGAGAASVADYELDDPVLV